MWILILSAYNIRMISKAMDCAQKILHVHILKDKRGYKFAWDQKENESERKVNCNWFLKKNQINYVLAGNY